MARTRTQILRLGWFPAQFSFLRRRLSFSEGIFGCALWGPFLQLSRTFVCCIRLSESIFIVTSNASQIHLEKTTRDSVYKWQWQSNSGDGSGETTSQWLVTLYWSLTRSFTWSRGTWATAENHYLGRVVLRSLVAFYVLDGINLDFENQRYQEIEYPTKRHTTPNCKREISGSYDIVSNAFFKINIRINVSLRYFVSMKVSKKIWNKPNWLCNTFQLSEGRGSRHWHEHTEPYPKAKYGFVRQRYTLANRDFLRMFQGSSP